MTRSDTPHHSRECTVVYLLEAFPKLSETFILNEMLEMRRQGIDVRIYSLDQLNESTVHKEALPLIKDTVYLDKIGKKEKLLSLLYLLLTGPLRAFKTFRYVSGKNAEELKWSLRTSFFLAREVQRLGARHIHAHFALEAAEHAMLVSMLSGVPYSMAPHAIDIYVFQKFLRDKMNHAAFIATECQYSKDYLAHYNPQYPKERIHVQRLGFNPDTFKSRGNIDKKASNTPFQLVSVSRLVEKKGLMYLIDALAALRDEGLEFRSLIVGEGPEYENLESSIKAHQLESKVQLLGAMDSDQVKKVLDMADVYILPCIITDSGDRDATPTAIIEAMALGIPIISTTVAGIPEIVSKDAGILVTPRDSVALAKAIRTVYEMGDQERREMGEHGRQYVLTHCNIETEVKKLLGLMEHPVDRSDCASSK